MHSLISYSGFQCTGIGNAHGHAIQARAANIQDSHRSVDCGQVKYRHYPCRTSTQPQVCELWSGQITGMLPVKSKDCHMSVNCNLGKTWECVL